MEEKNNFHWKYAFGIVLLLFVLFFAYWFSDDKKLVEVISFAGTIASIILSVLAIFMTVLSNDSMASMIHRIRDVHDSIKDMPSSINHSIEQLRLSTSKIESILPEINGKLKAVDEHLKESNLNLSSVNDGKTDNPIYGTDGIALTAKEFLVSFLNNSSLTGLGVVYCLYLASHTNKNFKLQDYVSSFEFSNVDYSYAYCIACFANRLAVGQVDTQNDCLVSNVRFSNLISDKDIFDAIKTWLANMKDVSGNPTAEAFIKTIKNIFE